MARGELGVWDLRWWDQLTKHGKSADLRADHCLLSYWVKFALGMIWMVCCPNLVSKTKRWPNTSEALATSRQYAKRSSKFLDFPNVRLTLPTEHVLYVWPLPFGSWPHSRRRRWSIVIGDNMSPSRTLPADPCWCHSVFGKEIITSVCKEKHAL